MPRLMPRTFFSFKPLWLGPGGRLVWALLILTISLVWLMMLMKNRAVKNVKLGPGVIVGGFIVGAVMVWLGRIFEKTQLVKDTLVPNGYLIAWIAVIAGLLTSIASIRFSQLHLQLDWWGRHRPIQSLHP